MYLLGYDIGSSTIKAALVNSESNEEISVMQYPDQEMEIISRQRGWAEQQPELWWQHVCIATRKLLSQTGINPDEIKGIGIGYQMHGLVLIDSDMEVLRPSIIWCDSRAVPIGQKAFKDIGEEYCLQNYLNSPGNFTASKLKWVKDNEPETYEKIYKIMLPGDYIGMKFTDNVLTTISALSESVLWDFKNKRLADKVLEYYNLDHELLPDIAPTFGTLGFISKSASEQTGLSRKTMVAYKAGDQPNNAMSLNVLNPGEVAATSGTSGVVYGVVDKPIYDIQSRVNAFAHVNYDDNYDKIGILLCINGAGIQYSWIKNQIARIGRSYEDMERMLSSVPVGSEGVCMMPFGNGAERMFNNKNLGSHIYNLEFNRHSRAHLYRAALEGVAFSFAYGVEILKEMGLKVDILKVGNDNMFRSQVFTSTIATLLQCQIHVVDTTGAIGAARAAGVACGSYDSIEEAFNEVKPIKIYNPQSAYDRYQHAYNNWRNSLNKLLTGSPSRSEKYNEIFNQNHYLKNELKEKNKEIAVSTVKLDSLTNAMKDINSNLSKYNKASQNPQIKKLISRVNGLIKDSEKVTPGVFEQHLDLVSNNLITKLKSLHPNLSFDELKLCSFLRINLSTKEIAGRLNLSIRGVETKRYRIRKKMGLQKGESLSKYLDSV